MSMWMTIWTVLLITSGVAFLVVLAYVAFGVKAELIETLNDLKMDVDESLAHEEILDKPVD